MTDTDYQLAVEEIHSCLRRWGFKGFAGVLVSDRHSLVVAKTFDADERTVNNLCQIAKLLTDISAATSDGSGGRTMLRSGGANMVWPDQDSKL